MSPPPAEFLLVAVLFTAVMMAFGFAVHVVSGAAVDVSWSVARGISDGLRCWAAGAAARKLRPSSSPVAPVTVTHVHPHVRIGNPR